MRENTLMNTVVDVVDSRAARAHRKKNRLTRFHQARISTFYMFTTHKDTISYEREKRKITIKNEYVSLHTLPIDVGARNVHVIFFEYLYVPGG